MSNNNSYSIMVVMNNQYVQSSVRSEKEKMERIARRLRDQAQKEDKDVQVYVTKD